jgi:hypothetical protein
MPKTATPNILVIWGDESNWIPTQAKRPAHLQR